MKYTIITLLVLASVTCVHAQFNIVNEVYTGNYYRDLSITTEDIDGDGDKDVIIGYHYGSKIFWYENIDGKGAFSAHRVLPDSMGRTIALVASDFDNDNDIDIFAVSSGYNFVTLDDNKFVWYENIDGHGNFGSQQIIQEDSEGWPQSILVCLIDSDTIPDVFVLTTKQVSWYKHIDGNGLLSTVNIISDSLDYGTSICAADINGDGDNELMVLDMITIGFEIFIYEYYASNGTFQHIETIESSSSLSQVSASDLDGDGDIDLICSTGSSSKSKLTGCKDDTSIAWYENLDGLGTFSSQKEICNSLQIFSIDVGDLDNDNDNDILAYHRYSQTYPHFTVGWFENLDGNGSFSSFVGFPGTNGISKDVCISDIDNDGDNDAIAALWQDDNSCWFMNDGLGNFSSKQTIAPQISIQVVDINIDGNNDIVSSFQEDSKLCWFENISGTGEFSEQNIIANFEGNAGVFYCSNIDGDMDIDIVSTSSANNKIAWYENLDGQGIFGGENIINLSSKPTSLTSCDIDGDNDYDIISSSNETERLEWYENVNGEGTFSASHLISSDTMYIPTIVYCDIDGDNDNDIVISDFLNNRILWFENIDGYGDFSDEIYIDSLVNGVYSILAIDLDFDNDPDIISSSIYDDKLVWYENYGDGYFSSQIEIASSLNNVKSIYATDLDDDNDIDIITASQDGNEITWFENEGHNNFSIQNHIYFFGGVSFVCAHDLNSDSKVDIIAGSTINNEIIWLDNLIVGIEEPVHLEKAFVYPNPTNGHLNIDIDTESIVESINIYDIQGVCVYSLNKLSKTPKLDISFLKSGTYFLRIDLIEQTLIHQLIIE
jgi:hypothetical protein